MSSKKDVLSILAEDLRTKDRRICERYAEELEKVEKALAKAKEVATSAIFENMRRVLARWNCTLDKEHIKINFEGEGWGDIQAEGIRFPDFRKAVGQRERLLAAKKEEMGALHERATHIRRRIMLQGVDAEVLKLLESL